MRVSMSAMGSVIMGGSPAGLHEAGDLSFAREPPETESAHAEAAIECARTSAQRATGVGPDPELRGSGGFHHEAGLGQRQILYAPQGLPRPRSTDLPSASVRAVVLIKIVSPLILSTLWRLISGKITCSRSPRE